jgi:Predicted methyltransferase
MARAATSTEMPAARRPRVAARSLFVALTLACGLGAAASAAPTSPALDDAVADLARPVAEQARGAARHPLQTLEFFGLRPDMTVVEIWPMPGYYSEILAPFLRAHGHYIAAGFVVQPGAGGRKKRIAMEKYQARFTSDPARYGKIRIVPFGRPDHWRLGPRDSADCVLTFRNVHNWIEHGDADEVFRAMYRVLKPGGTLGLVEHRGWPGETRKQMIDTGYVPTATVEALARKAGFRLVASSNINANPRDDKHHPHGVWSLPPDLRDAKGAERRKLQAIGESDRMTLRFVKPQAAETARSRPHR